MTAGFSIVNIQFQGVPSAQHSRSLASGKNVEISIQQLNMPERMKMIIEWTGQCTGSYDRG